MPGRFAGLGAGGATGRGPDHNGAGGGPDAAQGTVVSARPTRKKVRAQAPEKVCRADEDTLRVLKLTAIEGGVRVVYRFPVSGAATWTSLNRPLLRQFGIRPGRTFCLPHDRNSDMHSADASDAE